MPFLHKIKFGQPIKTVDGPKWHAKKQGTPTMGGFMFIISTVITAIASYWIYRWKMGVDTTDKKSFYPFYLMLGCILFSAAFGIIGFIDDYTKVARKNNDGLTAKQKIALQLVFSVGFLAVIHFFGDGETRIDLGFWKSPSLGIFYYILMMAVIIYLTNAVNLTDGVDGLCGSLHYGTCRGLSRIPAVELKSRKMLYGRYRLNVPRCSRNRCGTYPSQASAAYPRCTCVYP